MKTYKRGFLNEREGTASFEWEVETDYKRSTYINADFMLSDCNRKVYLDFSAYGENTENLRTQEESLRKIDLIINELKEFRDAVASAELKPIVKEEDE